MSKFFHGNLSQLVFILLEERTVLQGFPWGQFEEAEAAATIPADGF
jgi:hypothetical protein